MIEIMINKLCKDIINYDGFVLYGAGYMAEILLGTLNEMGQQPLYCIVSNMKNNPQRINSVSVYSLEEKISELQKKNIVVIVAVSELYEKDIVSLLYQYEITDMKLVSQYTWKMLNQKTFWNIYKNKDFKWFVSRIEEWDAQHNSIDVDLLDLGEQINRNKDCIIFVIINLSPRVIKIAEALQKCGKKVILYLNENMKQSIWKTNIDSLNINVHFFRYVEELMFYLLRTRGEVIHIFSHVSEPYVAYILVKFQKHFGKIIFENYDIANGFYTNVEEPLLKLEQYCLENARGISYREFSLEYLTDVLNFKIQGKSISFFDFCSGEKISSLKENNSEELSICYSGYVITEDEYADCPHGGFVKIADNCEKNRCHLHIYPSVWDENRFRKYIEMNNNYKYFHFHKTVPYEKLLNEIAQYDYGMIPASDNMWDKECSGYNTKYKYIYAATNKFFDYLDAGLPIIAAFPLKMAQCLEKIGVLINWTNGEYDFQYLLKMKTIMHDRVLKEREKFKIEHQINRLIEFYDSI